MKKSLIIIIIFSLICLGFVYASVSETMRVSADILEPVVSISVPDSIFIGETTKGYITNKTKIAIENTGTTNIKVTPMLEEGYEGIFENLYFQRVLDDPLTKIGEFEINIARPSAMGGSRKNETYIYLDLTDYSGSIEEDLTEEIDLIFWAVAV
jgi:hypothetical protein